MEKYVVSRELAEKLKAAGYPQNISEFVYMPDSKAVFGYKLAESVEGWFAAPLSDELLEQLPKLINGNQFLSLTYPIDLWVADYTVAVAGRDMTKLSNMVTADKPADALAELWLFCKKNGHIKDSEQKERIAS